MNDNDDPVIENGNNQFYYPQLIYEFSVRKFSSAEELEKELDSLSLAFYEISTIQIQNDCSGLIIARRMKNFKHRMIEEL